MLGSIVRGIQHCESWDVSREAAGIPRVEQDGETAAIVIFGQYRERQPLSRELCSIARGSQHCKAGQYRERQQLSQELEVSRETTCIPRVVQYQHRQLLSRVGRNRERQQLSPGS